MKSDDVESGDQLSLDPAESKRTLVDGPHPHRTSRTVAESAPVMSGASDALTPIERLSLYELMGSIASRLSAVEAAVLKHVERPASAAAPALETAKLLLGGWPAFGFVFLFLFYVPLRDVLTSIPDKVKAASEIAIPGLSLKSTIERVATSQGLSGLAQTIPKLSNGAIELLLRAPRSGGSESLVSFTNSDDDRSFSAFNFPADQTVRALVELQANGFIKLEGSIDGKLMVPLEGRKLEELLLRIRRTFPGSAQSRPGDERTNWRLHTPVPQVWKDRPQIMWSLTDAGSQAVDLVLRAVSTELSQGNSPAPGQ